MGFKQGTHVAPWPAVCGCWYRKEHWKHASHIPTSIPTDSKLCYLVSCYANPRDSDTKMWCILWIYMNISYIIFIWSCFCPMSKRSCFIPLFYVFVMMSSSGRKHTVFFLFFFLHMWQSWFSWLFSNGCLSDGLFSQAFSVTSIRWRHYGLCVQYALICFSLFSISYRHLI